MFDSTRLLLFLTAALLLAVAPGPGMLYVLARTLAGGKREGLLSALGTLLGGREHGFAAALGCGILCRQVCRGSISLLPGRQNDQGCTEGRAERRPKSKRVSG